MAVKGLEQTRSRLDQAKRFGGLIVVAILVAALAVGILIISGLISFVPTPRITVFRVEIPGRITTFIGAFSLALGLLIAYVYFAALIKNTFEKVWEYWVELPTRIQAIVLGLEAGLVAGLALVVSNQLVTGFSLTTILVTAGVVLVVATLVTFRANDVGWTIAEWGRTLNMAALIAALVAILSGFVFAGVAPGYMPPAVFLLGWAVCAYLFFRRRHAREDSVVTRFLVGSGYAQMRQVETVSVSIGTGLAAALVVAILVAIAGTAPSGTLRRAVLSIAVVWPVVTFATSVGWPDVERTDLVIDDISVRTSTEMRELTVRNVGDRPVDLQGAKAIDATNELYHVGFTERLGTGGTAKFEIPEDFELGTHDPYEVSSLPLGMVLMKNATEPEIVTRDGKAYILFWIDQLEDQE